jgi:eukaryotic-like serine/threonine-protein kinase
VWAPALEDADETVEVGDILADRFETTRILGRGGMGTVFEARCVALTSSPHSPVEPGAMVALKLLHAKHMQNREAVARFLNEGRAAASVRGEHSARVLEVAEHAGRPLIVMELLRGEDLSSVQKRGPLDPSLACLFILQACEGMAEVHAVGMVHRDLKPSNLFLTQRADGSPLVKVLDFGIAKCLVQDDEQVLVQTLTAVALGTPLYMSPEQIRSSGEVDGRADVWSLGTILYELLTGRPAFGGNTVSHITAQILERDPPPPSMVAPHLGTRFNGILSRALAKDPAARFQNVAELARQLEPHAGPRGAGVTDRVQRWVDARRSDPSTLESYSLQTRVATVRKQSLALVLGLVGAATLLSGLAFLAYRQSRGPTGQPLVAHPAIQRWQRSLEVEARPTAPGPAPTPAVAPSVAASPAPSPARVVASSPRVSATPTARTAAGAPETSPTPTVKPQVPFDPFRERN